MRLGATFDFLLVSPLSYLVGSWEKISEIFFLFFFFCPSISSFSFFPLPHKIPASFFIYFDCGQLAERKSVQKPARNCKYKAIIRWDRELTLSPPVRTDLFLHLFLKTLALSQRNCTSSSAWVCNFLPIGGRLKERVGVLQKPSLF